MNNLTRGPGQKGRPDHRTRRRHKRRIMRLRCFALSAIMVIALVLWVVGASGTGDRETDRTQEPGDRPATTTAITLQEHLPEPTPEPPPASPFTEEDVDLMAELLTAEALVVKWDGERWGVSAYARIAAVGWCALNRYDRGTATLEEVIKKPHQFAWVEGIEAPEDIRQLAADILDRYWAEKQGQTDVGRTLPASYLFFCGDGRENYFREEYEDTGEVWDWSLPDPYAEPQDRGGGVTHEGDPATSSTGGARRRP